MNFKFFSGHNGQFIQTEVRFRVSDSTEGKYFLLMNTEYELLHSLYQPFSDLKRILQRQKFQNFDFIRPLKEYFFLDQLFEL